MTKTAMTFKQLVKAIAHITSREEWERLYGEITRSYDKEKISFADYELLFDLLVVDNAKWNR